MEKRVADSLQLNSGAFGNPVIIGEVNAQYASNGWNVRVIGTSLSIQNASNINKAYANNTPSSAYGGYCEAGYNLLYKKYRDEKALVAFARYEYMDMSAKIPSNGIQNDANKQQYIVAGFTFKPIRGVAVKADYVRRITGATEPCVDYYPVSTTSTLF